MSTDDRTHGVRRSIAVMLVRHGLCPTQASARTAVDVVISEIARIAVAGDPVEVRGLGVFRRHELPARTLRNPRTGETVEVPASWIVRFRPGKYLRGRIEK